MLYGDAFYSEEEVSVRHEKLWEIGVSELLEGFMVLPPNSLFFWFCCKGALEVPVHTQKHCIQ